MLALSATRLRIEGRASEPGRARPRARTTDTAEMGELAPKVNEGRGNAGVPADFANRVQLNPHRLGERVTLGHQQQEPLLSPPVMGGRSCVPVYKE